MKELLKRIYDFLYPSVNCSCEECKEKKILLSEVGAALENYQEDPDVRNETVDNFEELEAQAAAYREKLKVVLDWVDDTDNDSFNGYAEAKKVLESSTAGRELLERMARVEKQKNNILESYKANEYTLQQYRELVNAVQGKDYWVWIPDDENHLESLTCPVLIPAEWLRNLTDNDRMERLEKTNDAMKYYIARCSICPLDNGKCFLEVDEKPITDERCRKAVEEYFLHKAGVSTP